MLYEVILIDETDTERYNYTLAVTADNGAEAIALGAAKLRGYGFQPCRFTYVSANAVQGDALLVGSEQFAAGDAPDEVPEQVAYEPVEETDADLYEPVPMPAHYIPVCEWAGERCSRRVDVNNATDYQHDEWRCHVAAHIINGSLPRAVRAVHLYLGYSLSDAVTLVKYLTKYTDNPRHIGSADEIEYVHNLAGALADDLGDTISSMRAEYGR